MLENTTTQYGSVSKALHWVMAALIIALIAVGLYMTGLDKEDPTRGTIYSLHKASGVLALLLVIARVAWFMKSPAPALPAVYNVKEQRLFKINQSLLYILMFVLPISGYVMSTAAGFSISFFGLFDLPMLFDKNKALGDFAHEMHEFMGHAISLFILLHIAGAVKHRLKDKGTEADILQRML